MKKKHVRSAQTTPDASFGLVMVVVGLTGGRLTRGGGGLKGGGGGGRRYRKEKPGSRRRVSSPSCHRWVAIVGTNM